MNIFYQFWPELFSMDKPIIHRLLTPNLVAYNKKERVYFRNIDEFDKVKLKYKNHSIVYYKGLGSMEIEDWDEILCNLEKYIMPMNYDDDLDRVFELLFSDNIVNRKLWLSSN